MEELACYDPHPDVARMVVANKVDQVGALTWGATVGTVRYAISVQ
jgi:hypothetical protein